MLSFIIIIFMYFAIFKLNGSIQKNKDGYLNHGVSNKEYKALIFTLWLYVLPIFIMLFPVKYLAYFMFPIPFLILLFIPGIKVGKKIEKILSTSGIDVGVKAGRVADNVKALGIGSLLLALGMWAFPYFNLYLESSL